MRLWRRRHPSERQLSSFAGQLQPWRCSARAALVFRQLYPVPLLVRSGCKASRVRGTAGSWGAVRAAVSCGRQDREGAAQDLRRHRWQCAGRGTAASSANEGAGTCRTGSGEGEGWPEAGETERLLGRVGLMIAGAADLIPRRRPATSRSDLDPYHRSHLNPPPSYSGPTSTVISFHSSGLPDPTLDASNSPKPPAAGYQCSARRAHRLAPFPFSHRRLRRSHLPTRGSLNTPDPRRWKGDDRDDDIATHFFISSL